MIDNRNAVVASSYDRVEAGFTQLGHLVHRRAWWVIAICSAIAVGLLSGVPLIRTDFSSDSYLLPGDDTQKSYDAFRERFGLDERVVVGLEPVDVFDLGFLATLREIHAAIEREVPYLEEVTSLVNARNTRGEGDELIVEDLLERWPKSEAELPALREKVLANPTYRNSLISEDARYTVILIRAQTYSSKGAQDEALERFEAASGGEPSGGEDREPGEAGLEYLTDRELDEFVSTLYDVVARYQSEELSIRLSGDTVLGHRATEIAREDTVLFAVLSLFLTVVVLYLLFRRISAAVLPALLVMLSLGRRSAPWGCLGFPSASPPRSCRTS